MSCSAGKIEPRLAVDRILWIVSLQEAQGWVEVRYHGSRQVVNKAVRSLGGPPAGAGCFIQSNTYMKWSVTEK